MLTQDQESTLAQLTPYEARTDVYAWFAVTSTLGMSTGLFTGGFACYLLREWLGWQWKETFPAVFVIYAVIGLIKTALTFSLSDRCEQNYDRQTELDIENQEEAASPLMSNEHRRISYSRTDKVTATVRRISDTVSTKVSPTSKTVLLKLSVLFAINSFASGMLPVTIMAWYVNWRSRWFVINRLGYFMSLVWLVASVANLFSASVARRIGLIRTMVLTHLPNAIFLAFIPLAPTWWILAMLLLASSAFGSMDQAPRSAFVAAVFLPSERTYVMGTLNLVRTVASSGGPLLTGYFHDKKMWGAVFVIVAILKICYDLGLLAMFVGTKLPEQQRGPRENTIVDVDVGILLSENRSGLTPPESHESAAAEEGMVDYTASYGKTGYQEM